MCDGSTIYLILERRDQVMILSSTLMYSCRVRYSTSWSAEQFSLEFRGFPLKIGCFSVKSEKKIILPFISRGTNGRMKVQPDPFLLMPAKVRLVPSHPPTVHWLHTWNGAKHECDKTARRPLWGFPALTIRASQDVIRMCWLSEANPLITASVYGPVIVCTSDRQVFSQHGKSLFERES